jgi:hypothetical protein
MANPQKAGSLQKTPVGGGLGKSTLINPSLTIPMPSGAATPPPSTGQGQGKPSSGASGSSSQDARSNG